MVCRIHPVGVDFALHGFQAFCTFLYEFTSAEPDFDQIRFLHFFLPFSETERV